MRLNRPAAVTAVLALIGVFAFGSSAALASTSAPLSMNSSSSISTQTPTLVTTNAGAVLAADDSYDTGTGIGAIQVFRSPDGGLTWGSPTVLSTPGVNSNQVTLAKMNDGAIVAAWAEESGPSATYEIHLVRSVDDGISWSSQLIVGSTGTASAFAEMPKLAAYGPAGIALEYVVEDGHQTLATVRTSPDFAVWSAPVTLSAPSTYADAISLAVSGLSVNVAWVEYDPNNGRVVKVANSSSWQNPTTLSSQMVSAYLSVAMVTLTGGQVVVAWRDFASAGPHYDIKARTSTDGGASWQSATSLSMATMPDGVTLTATADGGVLAAWNYGTGGYTTIATRHSAPGASSWPNAEVSVTNGVTGTFEYSQTVASQTNGALSMVWTKSVAGSPIQYCAAGATSADFGATWVTNGCVTPTYPGSGGISGATIVPLLGSGVATGWWAHTSSYGGFVTVSDWTAPVPPAPIAPAGLPSTGANSLDQIEWAALLLVLGAAGIIAARRAQVSRR